MIYEVLKYFTSCFRLNWFKITLRSLSKLFELLNLKNINSFQILHRFAKSLSFFCKNSKLWNIPNGFIDEIIFGKDSITKTSYASFKMLKQLKIIYRLNKILNTLKFFEQAIWDMKLWRISIQFIEWISLQKFWNVKQAFWALKFWIKWIHSIDWISLRKSFFFNLLNFFSFCFIDKNSYRFFFQRTTKALKIAKNQRFYILNRFAKNLLLWTSYSSFEVINCFISLPGLKPFAK